MTGFWNKVLEKIAGTGLAKKLCVRKHEKISRASRKDSRSPNHKRPVLERTCSIAIHPAEAAPRHTHIQLRDDRWVVPVPTGAGTRCHPGASNHQLYQRRHDSGYEYGSTMTGRQQRPSAQFPEISVRCCYKREDGDEYVPVPNFIMDNYYSLYPVIQPGVENEPGFPGWKQIHDNLEELYLRNHGPDIWRIKESVKDILRGRRTARTVLRSTPSQKARSPVLLRGQFDAQRNSGLLYSPHSLRRTRKIRDRDLSFSKVMSCPGPSRASALTSLLHDGSRIDPDNTTVPDPAAIIQDLINEMGDHGQEHSAVLSGCAIESYTPPGERRPIPLSPSSPSSSSFGGSMWKRVSSGTFHIRALRDTNARMLRLNIPADECAVESYTPSEDWDHFGWRWHEQDQPSCNDTSGMCSAEADSSCWEKVQETADTSTPPPLSPANPAIVHPSPEIKPRMDIVPPARVAKVMKSRELIKIGKRRIYRVVRPKRLGKL
ncbi:hypothetical protein PVAR5_7372 [Paecilomyces variotii No. 5]|uniref:Uncharacterized protein n=1 Tax=Byssochlamys spectabilis (strain No. 5 / NBRC 109023) TaxID=1356009 RepID=V5G2P5_BYSSN|nr:hypothetical protein PVAR5_7372 [Paecilomyces variotii No. 5]